MDEINDIIIKCKSDIKKISFYDFFIVKDLSDIIHNQSDVSYNIKTNKIPLLYFFDKYLNEKINITISHRNSFVSSIKNIYTISNLNKNYIIDINIDNHSVILYPFNYDGRYYIYLSNSGLGISNQNTNLNKTSCKLFHITKLQNIDKIYDMFILINEIIQLIQYASYENYLDASSLTSNQKRKELHEKIDLIWDNIHDDFIEDIGSSQINRQFLLYFFSIIFKNAEKNLDNMGYINLIYLLLNYLAQVDFMNECSFNHLLFGRDHPKFADIINNLIYDTSGSKFSFNDLYKNCINGYNNNVYKLLREEIDTAPINSNFINDIDLKLNQYARIKKTIEFKRNDFILELNNSGLYNYVQVGGSCSFYSFYNLLMNILFLTNYNLYQSNPLKAVQNVINPLMTIHYTLLEYLCMCNDTKYLANTNNFYPNQIFHMNYIYNIMIKNNLMDEINDFYPSSTLMIFSKTPLIDRLLEFRLSDDNFHLSKKLQFYSKKDVVILKEYFNRIDILFNNYINIIRNLSDLSTKSLVIFRNQIYNIYGKINAFFEHKQDIYQYCLKYFNISKDIIIIYCYYLLNIYSKKSTSKKYIKKKYSLKLLAPIYTMPSYINTDNCGALSDCRNKKCDLNVYNCFYTYHIDYILNKFSSYEINAMSVSIGHFEVDIKTKINELLVLKECSNIDAISVEFYNLDFYTNNIYFEYNDNTYRSRRLISKYFRNKYLSINILLHKDQRDTHSKKCKYIIKALKSYISEILDISSLSTFKAKINDLISIFNLLTFDALLNLLLFILSDGGYICLSPVLCTDITFFSLMSLMNDDTQIIYNYQSNDFIIEKIYNLIEENTEYDIVDDNIQKHSNWISKYNIIFDHSKYFVYNGKNYIYNLKIKYNHSLSIILARFGLHEQNQDEYILLFPDSNIKFRLGVYVLYRYTNFNFFICIKKTKTIIELNIVNSYVDINNCYLFKNGKKHKLEFNNYYPILSNFSETTPYLCYKENNKLFIHTIVSNAFWCLSSTKIYKYLFYRDNIEQEEYKYRFDIYQYDIASSNTFPTNKTNNIEYIRNIYKMYPSDRKLEFTNEQLLKRDLSIDNTNINKLTIIIKNIAKILCKNINCDEKTNEIFKSIFEEELIDSAARNDVLESFLKDNRLCVRFDFNQDIISLKSAFETHIEAIHRQMMTMHHNFDKTQFIIDNLTNIIVIMEINILINELFQINVNTSCWDIQLLITKLDSMLLFNRDIQTNSYHLFELLFLFQNNYFFRENQLDKYKQIVNDIILNNGSLTIHQFMMGKGKTSFLTPLLSMVIYLMTGKKAIIITTDHLIPQTIKIMRYIHYLGDIPFEVATDYEYKHFWLEKTDITLEKNFDVDNHQLNIQNISNTCLIIDEFNSHYDYTQSMFNLVKKQEYISEEMFYYIFDYIHSKIFKTPFVRFIIPEKVNYDIFESILDYEYNVAIHLKYNEKYGFTNISGDLRLCIPYSRKDTPLYGSRFSSIILTIILTVNYYIITQKYKLDEKYDYQLIYYNDTEIIKIAPSEIFNEWYEYFNKHNHLDEDIIKNSLDKLYTSNIETYIHLFKKILYISNKSGLVFATEQYNVSFQDIIYNVYDDQWKVGYTGTIYLNPDIYIEDDKFVFKNIIEDFDEKIEVKLALKGYGCFTSYNDSVVIINTDNQNEVLNQLSTIISFGINRGIVDIAGLFIDYKNIDIAILLKQLLPKEHIVYLSDKGEGLEYNTTLTISENLNNKYKPFDDHNFYYYDQCHIVGTDLEQPTQGYIAVIINKDTKWTEFAQGIFRFRKLNRGTYLKLFYITESNDETPLTNDNILNLLIKNESAFQENQKLGIKYQLMKAMVRKLSKNYLEDKLINDFLLSTAITPKDCIEFLKNNIKYLENVILEHEQPYLNYIYKLYNDITSNEDELIKLVIGGNSIKKQIDMEIMENIDIQKLSVELIKYNKKIKYKYDIITHINCQQCIDTTSVPLFINQYNCLINGKKIYISINIALGFEKNQPIETSLLIFVELPNIILLELDYIAYDYYSHKVPIYDFNGNLINTFLQNTLSSHPLKLDIDYRFLYLFDIKNYINPMKEKNQGAITKQIILDVEKNINIEASKIIFLFNNNLSSFYKNFFDMTPIIQHLLKISSPDDFIDLIKSSTDDNVEHKPEYRLDNIHFNRDSGINGMVLKTEVFPMIRRVPFQIIYDKYYHRLDTLYFLEKK
jgi:hypothetical protein